MKKGSDSLEKEEKLIEIIKSDMKLTFEVRLEFINLANSFLEDFKDNLGLTSIELNEKYGFGLDAWQVFLNHPPISKYIKSFVNELANKRAHEALATGKGTRDAIGVIKELERYSETLSNDRFVVFRLPDKNKEEDTYEYSGEV